MNLHKKSILKKTFQVGFLFFISRLVGTAREVLQARFLGVGVLSDAFLVAWRIPNFLRKVFAEGALSASFVPHFIKVVKHGDKDAPNSLMSAAFLFFEGFVLLLSIIVFFKADAVAHLIAPGFSQEQINYTIPFLKILFPFVFFVSSCALLAGALQSVNHFFIPATFSVFINIIWVSTLLICIRNKYPCEYLCYAIIAGGFAQFLLHLIFYFKSGFSFGKISRPTIGEFKPVLKKFLQSFAGVSVIEVNLLVDSILYSYLPAGSNSLLHYGARFMGIPLGIFAVAFSTILLSQFSRVVLYAPKRLNFYLLETSKFVTWVVVPATLFLIFVSEKLFSTVILAQIGTEEQIFKGKWILIILVSGLIFFSLNKILANIFYAFHDTWTPTVISIVSTVVNLTLNLLTFFYMRQYALFGIPASTVVAAFVYTALAFYFLRTKYKFNFYFGQYLVFLARYTLQLFVVIALCFLAFKLCTIHNFASSPLRFWALTIFVSLLSGLFLFFTNRFFKIRLYFLH